MRVRDIFRCPQVNISFADEFDDELDPFELAHMLRSIDPGMTKQQIALGVRQIDRDGKNAINSEEVTNSMKWASRLMRDRDLMANLACVVNQVDPAHTRAQTRERARACGFKRAASRSARDGDATVLCGPRGARALTASLCARHSNGNPRCARNRPRRGTCAARPAGAATRRRSVSSGVSSRL